MAYLIVCATAFLAAGLTFFAGFGLGTLLLPALALFFPIQVAVSATAVVHLMNNLFKLTLVGRDANFRVVLAFGVPAVLSAMLGAWLLAFLSGMPVLHQYQVAGRTAAITPVKLVIAVLIFVFALLDILPGLVRVAFSRRWIPLGGLLSGLLGGLSGHQGALRSAFLIKSGLTKEAFIGTGVTCAVLVDLSRLTVYGFSFFSGHLAALGEGNGLLLLAASTGAAFAGSFLGSRLVRKVTLVALQRIVGILLMAVAAAMGSGLI